MTILMAHYLHRPVPQMTMGVVLTVRADHGRYLIGASIPKIVQV